MVKSGIYTPLRVVFIVENIVVYYIKELLLEATSNIYVYYIYIYIYVYSPPSSELETLHQHQLSKHHLIGKNP